jgi:hypothetical protein
MGSPLAPEQCTVRFGRQGQLPGYICAFFWFDSTTKFTAAEELEIDPAE